VRRRLNWSVPDEVLLTVVFNGLPKAKTPLAMPAPIATDAVSVPQTIRRSGSAGIREGSIQWPSDARHDTILSVGAFSWSSDDNWVIRIVGYDKSF